MQPEIKQFIEHSDYYQGAVRDLAKLLPADDAELDALIGETVAASDQRAFIFITIAALEAQRPVDARHLARGTMLMPDKHALGTIALHMTGDIAQPLLEAVTSLNLETPELVSSALFLAAHWQKENNGRVSSKLIGAARTAARNKNGVVTDVAMLHAVAMLSGDEGLKTVVLERAERKPSDACVPGMNSGAVKMGEQSLTMWRLSPLCAVPALARTNVLAEGITMRRAVARTSRNAPCPCGSGKKYKHCCVEKDEERLHRSTSIAGVTREEFRADPEQYMTSIDLEFYPAHEVARFDPMKLNPDRREQYLANQCRAKLYDNCVAALEKFGYSDKTKPGWENIMLRVAQEQRKDLVERLLKLRPATEKNRTDGAVELLLAESNPAELVKTLQYGALDVLGDPNLEQYYGFSYTLLQSHLCALGVFVARGMIPILPMAHATALHDALLETRDKLCLPPEDPITDILDQRSVKQNDEGKDAAALREAQAKLEAKMKEVQGYRDSVKHLEKELHRRERLAAEQKPATPSTAPSVPVDQVALSEMRQKVKELKANLNERHNERNELRRELQKAYTDLEQLRETAAPVTDREQAESDRREDDLLLPEETAGQQPVRAIECPPDFQQTLRRVPPSVARGTMTALGRLAAGEPAAFMGAIRLKACPDIMRRRVGIDFRLLFRLLPDRLQVVDLIPRQDLERKIKTLV